MPRRKINGEDRLPSRDEIVAFLRDAPGKVGKREIARAFGLQGEGRIALKTILRELEGDGIVDRRGRPAARSGKLPQVFAAEVTGRDQDGELLAVPADWDTREQGPAPQVVIAIARKPKPGEAVPGVGNRVLVRLLPSRDGPRRAVRVLKVIPHDQSQALGIYRALPSGGGRILPVDKKAKGRELLVQPGEDGGAQDGELVSASLVRRDRFGLPNARVRERLGAITSEKTISLVAIHAHSIPHVFPAEVLAEAEAAEPATLAGREDWRDLALVTIDPADAKDHDDAVHAAPDEDPDNEGGFVLTVAIADVAAYVRPGSALDREALERGNSVYFPDRVVPMLPERISNDLCSLRAGEARPALAMRMVIGANGRKRRHSVHRVLMRSAAKLSYQQAQAAIDGRPDDTTGPLLEPVLRPLWAAYGCLARARDERAPLFLDLPERKILLKPDGTVDRVLVPERLDAHKLIEEFMILANVAAAETLEKATSPLIYRVHDEPSLEKMRALGEVLASVGIKLPKQAAVKAALFNRILGQVEGSEHQTFINEVVLRSQAQAVYAAENLGHFGLNLRRYAHFTSPIRRYADLVVHRALIRALRLGKDGLPAHVTPEELKEVSERISVAERRAMLAERETVDRLIAHHLAEQIGATFQGRISGVTKSGLFVKLAETGADGFVPASTIGADYYRFEEGRHALVGERTGETFRLGDVVEVKLVEAAPIAGALRFEIMSPGRDARPPRGGRARVGAPRGGKARPGSKAKPGRGRAQDRMQDTSWNPLDT